ncbi:hypothetical protein FSP39_005943 [Pinctada imbricata]|uniref:ATP-binding cassette sub-family A member 2 n=1 Tax=Pinctada imbricata TaxID=66713 RepID=A0AA88XKG8_PINIB|nr:hypothetical protein FSP39_005943 [Pinctada imbricata]
MGSMDSRAPKCTGSRDRMGFCHQYRLLLWKNFTLKKRSPFVLLFELCIPLVLFVILLLIRKKQPAVPAHGNEYRTNPLPSAGVIPITELFCEHDYNRDKNGFRIFQHSKTKQFLQQIQKVARHHHFFSPGYTPSEMDRLPGIYKSIIDDPATLHDQFEHAPGVSVESLLNSTSDFVEFLKYNLSLPSEDVDALLNSTIQLKEIYRLLFGTNLILSQSNIHVPSLRVKRDVGLPFSAAKELSKMLGDQIKQQLSSHLNNVTKNQSNISHFKKIQNNPDLLKQFVQSSLPNFNKELLYDVIDTDNLWQDKNIQVILESILFPNHSEVTPHEIADTLKLLLFSPTAIRKIVCDKDEFLKIFSPSSATNVSDLVDAQERLCQLNQSQIVELSHVLKREISDSAIIQDLHLKTMNISSLVTKVSEFMDNLQKFYQFQESLYEMTVFAENLPQDACNATIDFNQDGENVTMATNNTTPHPDVDNENKKDKEKKQLPKQPPKQNKFSGLLHLWNTMQKTICGKPPPNLPKERIEHDINSLNLRDLGISVHQQNNLVILVHVLYNNPRVLYAPNNSAADQIIKKANESFAMIDLMSEYARKWLNVSAEIRTYLLENTTAQHLASIQQMQREIRMSTGVISKFIKDSKLIKEFLESPVPSIPFFLHELDIIDNAACSWLSLMSGINLNVFKGFKTEEDLVDYFQNKAYSENVTAVAGVVFENIKPGEKLPAHVKYKIRQNATFTFTTKSVRSRFWMPGPGAWQHPYYQFGFIWIQDIMERAIIDMQVGRDVVEPGSYVQQFPQSCYLYDQFVSMIEHVMPLCLTISWVYTVSMLVQSIVYEKEQRLKEVMRMMGLSNAVHWCAWFTVVFVQMTVTMCVLTVMLKVGEVLTYSNPYIVFIVLEIFAIVTICFSFLVSTCYSKAKVAAACAGIVYFLTYVPYMYVAIREDVAGDQISAVVKSAVSLFSTTAFGLSGKYFAFYEKEGVGVQWYNIHLSPVENDQFNLLTCIMMMVMDTFLYCILSWYIENVFPGSYGLPKPWYFLFTRQYWCGGTYKSSEIDCTHVLDMCRRHGHTYQLIGDEEQACGMEPRDAEFARRFESEPTHIPLGVSIVNLTKIYKTGKKLAVNKLSLNLFEDQITSFLGHNGAGKTTTMSILTGLFPPTSGHAVIYDNDIRTEMDEIRQSLGMCPQHNVLFDKLTVEEHLWFYARLKGMKGYDIKQEMETMIEDVGLPKKRHFKVDCLSGGMQRKLSVAIAFVGGSQMVILDEPTAGVDPYARRAIWDLLIKYKHGRTILLSTHHMDEADILGDRIAIISNGELKCCGSSIFLKNTFGDGYHLYLVKKASEEDIASTDLSDVSEQNGKRAVNESFVSRCKASKVTDFINKHVSTAYLKSESNRELHYILPFEEAKKGNFEKLFSQLDSKMDQLHLTSYGVMDTTLEEVFLKVTEAGLAEEEAEDNKSENASSVNPLDLNLSDQDQIDTTLPSDSFNMETNGINASDSTSVTVTNSLGFDVGTMSRRGHFRTASNISNISLEEIQNMENSRFSEDDSLIVPDTGSSHKGGYSKLATEDTFSAESDSALYSKCRLEGKGSYVLSKNYLRLNQFRAIIVKRFHYITRNWKGLFSQIILPALFISVAMTVALSAPQVDDMPPIELSPSQYFNITQPRGNYIPFTDESQGTMNKPTFSKDAGPNRMMNTFRLASGVGATCVLRSAYNSTFDVDWIHSANYSDKNFELLRRYYSDKCGSVFVSGIHIASYTPQVPFVHPKNLKNGTSIKPIPTNPQNKKPYYPTCFCADDKSGFVCSGSSSYETPPEFRVVSKDILQNITGSKTQDFLLYTQDPIYRLHRYGGLSFGMVRDNIPDDFGKDAPPLFRKIAVKTVAKAWYNHKGYHAMPVYLNTLNNAILRANLDPATKGNPAAYGITATNHPMKETNNQLNEDYILQGSDVLISIFIIVAMSFVPASFVVFLVYERSIKSKHLQFVSGIDPVMYWLANYVWDICNYIIPALCIIIILLIFQIPSYSSPQNMPAVVSLFLLYGWSITPVMYPASFWFKEPSAAYISLIVVNLFTGITCIVSSFLLEIFSYDHDLKKVNDIIKDVFLMFPNYCLGRGLMDIAYNEYRNEFYYKTGQYDKVHSPFTWDLTGKKLVAMTVMGLCFFLITLLCEFKFFLKRRLSHNPSLPVYDEDIDVAGERKRVLRGSGRNDLLRIQNLTKVSIQLNCQRKGVLRGSGRNDLLRIQNLTKVYKTRKLGKHLAVDKLCLGVPTGECFGLLGVNGAGKTTTFKMLTGDILPSSGNAYLNRFSIVKDMLKVQQNIGYCPQFDALYDELTAREHIQLYARLRGVPPREEKQVVEWALTKLGLTKYADKPSGTYSGGNKRKLSTAIALVGHPPLIFMDEPTTGMDPHSRRFLWDLIHDLVKNGRSVILTSHSMEECEALCSRLAIMVNGQFKCLGSAQHLKNKYGEGYTFSLRLKGPDFERSQAMVKRFIERRLPDAVPKECHYNLLQYEYKKEGFSLSELFGKLEEALKDLDIEDYSVSQNNLDNVFINFVKQQVEIVQESEEMSSEQSGCHSDDDPLIRLDNASEDGLGCDDDVTFSLNNSGVVNLALNRSTDMSSISFHTFPHTSDRAVDGNNDTNILNGHCIHTREAQTTVWWRVRLTSQSTIQRIYIVYRTGFGDRLAGYSLFVTDEEIRSDQFFQDQNQPLFRDTGPNLPSTLQNLQLTPPVVGQVVTIYNNRSVLPFPAGYSSDALLELCEVEVFGM